MQRAPTPPCRPAPALFFSVPSRAWFSRRTAASKPLRLSVTSDTIYRNVNRTALANGSCASFNGILPNECLSGEIFYSLREAKVIIEQRRTRDNTRRPHSALAHRPPAPVTIAPPPGLDGTTSMQSSFIRPDKNCRTGHTRPRNLVENTSRIADYTRLVKSVQ